MSSQKLSLDEMPDDFHPKPALLQNMDTTVENSNLKRAMGEGRVIKRPRKESMNKVL